ARNDGAAAMIEGLRRTIAPHEDGNISLELTGPPRWPAEIVNAARRDPLHFTLWGFGLGLAMAFVVLRSLPAALLVAATPFVAVVWSTGVVLLLFGSFSFLTIIVTTLVLVISFAESMFFTYNWLA